MADGEEGDILHNVLGAIQEEDDTQEKQQMVIAGDHVFGAQIDEGANGWAVDRLDKISVAALDSMAEGMK